MLFALGSVAQVRFVHLVHLKESEAMYQIFNSAEIARIEPWNLIYEALMLTNKPQSEMEADFCNF